MISACQSGADSGAASDQDAPQVKPAAAPVAAESDTLQPDTETAELPRGVSAPAPAPQPERVPRSASAEPPAHDAKLAAPANKTDEPKAPASAAARSAKPAASSAEAPAPRQPTPAAPKAAAPKPAAAKPPIAATPRSAQPEPPVAQEPIAPVPPPPPPPAPRASVIVPETDHVHVEVPAGLQHWLDEDDRMKPWLSKAINVADACYAKVRQDDAGAAGVIALSITMHENARPSGRVSSVSGPINSIVMCATSRLLGVKMPLFTGTEGDSYTARVHFVP